MAEIEDEAAGLRLGDGDGGDLFRDAHRVVALGGELYIGRGFLGGDRLPARIVETDRVPFAEFVAGDIIFPVVNAGRADRAFVRGFPIGIGGDGAGGAIGMGEFELEKEMGLAAGWLRRFPAETTGVPALAQDCSDHVRPFAQLSGDVVGKRFDFPTVGSPAGRHEIVADFFAVQADLEKSARGDVEACGFQGFSDLKFAAQVLGHEARSCFGNLTGDEIESGILGDHGLLAFPVADEGEREGFGRSKDRVAPGEIVVRRDYGNTLGEQLLDGGRDIGEVLGFSLFTVEGFFDGDFRTPKRGGIGIEADPPAFPIGMIEESEFEARGLAPRGGLAVLIPEHHLPLHGLAGNEFFPCVGNPCGLP